MCVHLVTAAQLPATALCVRPLFETFLANTWEHRLRLFPLRMDSCDGLEQVHRIGAHVGKSVLMWAEHRPTTYELPCNYIVRRRKLNGACRYIDADHRQEAVAADLRAASRLFPDATLAGDDWQWPGVRAAVSEHCATLGGHEVRSHPKENWWLLARAAPGEAELLAGARRARASVDFVPASGTVSE